MKEIRVRTRDMGAYEAEGCGHKQNYVVRAGEVLPDDGSEVGETSAAGD